MQDEQVFCITIEDISASVFSCRLNESGTIRCGEPISALFVLPLDEPLIIIRTEVSLISIGGNEDARLFCFCFYEMSDDDRELIHRYIIQKQFEMIKMKDRQNWHEENEEDFSIGN